MPGSVAFIILLEIDFFQLHYSNTGISRDMQETPEHLCRTATENSEFIRQSLKLFSSYFEKQSSVIRVRRVTKH